jgi:hypothetical protein
MSDGKRRPVLHESLKGLLDLAFGCRVWKQARWISSAQERFKRERGKGERRRTECTGGFVEQQDRRGLEHRSSERDSLFLLSSRTRTLAGLTNEKPGKEKDHELLRPKAERLSLQPEYRTHQGSQQPWNAAGRPLQPPRSPRPSSRFVRSRCCSGRSAGQKRQIPPQHRLSIQTRDGRGRTSLKRTESCGTTPMTLRKLAWVTVEMSCPSIKIRPEVTS